MEQAKALTALEPFLALSKTATSPRAAADLIVQATSAPNTFVFAELLHTPQVQALAQSDAYRSHLQLLNIFSYGTYKDYLALASELPSLDDAQILKLRQLSLLTLARDRENLYYDRLQQALNISSARQLEDLVIKAVYQGLLSATLDPARQAVRVTSVAPLRDLRPGSIPELISALNKWSSRCTSTLGTIESNMATFRSSLATRAAEERAEEEKLRRFMAELREPDKSLESSRRGPGKRAMVDQAVTSAETMELDEPEEQTKRAGKRKM
ncbi:hypothetical protein L249_1346 [Ophiocordyceps polyrhachis-furcata BCC 54312]|uniref:PCI domain-containing protein n=1 Tax=Ophiocordyceps polyrhachis-furcata BCC 54312 TaxID=1330021 RepID=A0A367LER0_9HYPO|nr:hypothetical protein L249_1346 [Ophiocordyceps polyrhachis-furcata BCC 54312]